MLSGWTSSIHQKRNAARKRALKVEQQAQLLAEKYDAWKMALPEQVHCPMPHELPLVLAIGGGKGGVGKSLLSANLASRLAQVGRKVLLVDLDWGGANLHTYFGLGIPKKTLERFFAKELDSLGSIAIRTPYAGVGLVAGGQLTEIGEEQHSRVLPKLWTGILHAQKDLRYDTVILDLGAGIHRQTVEYFIGAHLGMITVLPEPTSIENAYSFVKATSAQMMLKVGASMKRQQDALHLAHQLCYTTPKQKHLRLMSYNDRLNAYEKKYPELVHSFRQAVGGRELGILLNQTRSHRDLEIGKSMEHICSQYFGFSATYLGHLNYDEVAWKALRNQRLLISDFPHSLLAKRIGDVAQRVLECLGSAHAR